jgi:hypothetical protein
MHHLGVFAENAVCAFHFWEEFQGRAKTGFPGFFFFSFFFFNPDPRKAEKSRQHLHSKVGRR